VALVPGIPPTPVLPLDVDDGPRPVLVAAPPFELPFDPVAFVPEPQ
jgi:hypothetical protein